MAPSKEFVGDVAPQGPGITRRHLLAAGMRLAWLGGASLLSLHCDLLGGGSDAAVGGGADAGPGVDVRPGGGVPVGGVPVAGPVSLRLTAPRGGGVPGDGPGGAISCLSFVQTARRTGLTAAGAPRVAPATVQVSKAIDSASPLLWGAMVAGRPLTATAELRTDAADAAPFLIVVLTQAVVSDLATAGPAGAEADASLVEQLTLTFRKVKWTFPAGGVTVEASA